MDIKVPKDDGMGFLAEHLAVFYGLLCVQTNGKVGCYLGP